MPVRLEECTPEVQKLIWQRRLPKSTVEATKEIDLTFDPMSYIK